SSRSSNPKRCADLYQACRCRKPPRAPCRRGNAASRRKHNQTAISSVQAAVGDQRGVARVAGVEKRFAGECAADRAAVVGKGGIASGARVEYNESATSLADYAASVGKGAIASSGCGRGKIYEAAVAVGKGAIACGRVAVESDHPGIVEGAIARGGGVDE